MPSCPTCRDRPSVPCRSSDSCLLTPDSCRQTLTETLAGPMIGACVGGRTHDAVPARAAGATPGQGIARGEASRYGRVSKRSKQPVCKTEARRLRGFESPPAHHLSLTPPNAAVGSMLRMSGPLLTARRLGRAATCCAACRNGQGELPTIAWPQLHRSRKRSCSGICAMVYSSVTTPNEVANYEVLDRRTGTQAVPRLP